VLVRAEQPDRDSDGHARRAWHTGAASATLVNADAPTGTGGAMATLSASNQRAERPHF